MKEQCFKPQFCTKKLYWPWNNLCQLNGILGHDSALYGYTGPGTTWVNEMSFVMKHAPSAGSIARPIDQQSSTLPLCQGRPLQPGPMRWLINHAPDAGLKLDLLINTALWPPRYFMNIRRVLSGPHTTICSYVLKNIRSICIWFLEYQYCVNYLHNYIFVSIYCILIASLYCKMFTGHTPQRPGN